MEAKLLFVDFNTTGLIKSKDYFLMEISQEIGVAIFYVGAGGQQSSTASCQTKTLLLLIHMWILLIILVLFTGSFMQFHNIIYYYI